LVQDRIPVYCKLEFIGMDPVEDRCFLNLEITKHHKNRDEIYNLAKLLKDLFEGKDIRLEIGPLHYKREENTENAR